MIKKNGGIFGRNPTYNDVVVEGVLTLKEAQVFDNDITINGDLTVNGTTTTVNTVELSVDDKNITMGDVVAKVGLTSASNITAGQFTVLIADTAGLIPGMTVTKTAGTGAFAAGAKIASVDSHYQITLDLAHTVSGSITFDTGGATDFTADGGGITLKGLTDKFIKWIKSTGAWTFSDKIEVPDVTVTNMTASLAVFTDSNKKLVTQSQQNALNAIAGAVTSGSYLRGDGTNVGMSAIQAADVPTLNQATTSSSGSVKSNSTTGLLQVTGPAAGSTRVMTTPDANFTAARTDAGQTFTGTNRFGNVNIGSNTVSAADTNGSLTMMANGTGSVELYVAPSGSNEIFIRSNSASNYQNNDTPRLNFVGYGQTAGCGIQAVNVSAYGVKDLVFYNHNATDYTTYYEAMRIKGIGGNVVAAIGNFVVGTSGKGIDFSATADPASGMTSELLNDYEEGTWTPVYASETGSFTSITTSNSGRYVKIGKTVYVWLDARTTASTTLGTAGGKLFVTGLPYTASSAGGSGTCSIFQSFNLGTAFTNLGVVIEASQSRMYFTKNSSNSGVTYVQATEVNTAAGSFNNLLGVFGMYQV